MPSVLPLIVPLVTSLAGDLRGVLKWRALPRATFVLLIRDPTNAKTLGTDGRYYDSLPQRAKSAADTVLTKQRSIALAFLECPDALGWCPCHQESRIILNFYATFPESFESRCCFRAKERSPINGGFTLFD